MRTLGHFQSPSGVLVVMHLHLMQLRCQPCEVEQGLCDILRGSHVHASVVVGRQDKPPCYQDVVTIVGHSF